MSTVVSQQRQLRAFLTQSAHSTGAALTRRPATATATLGGFESLFDDTDLTLDATRPATPNSAMIRLAATVDEARSKMSSLRRLQLMEAEQLTRLSRRSDELKNYNRDRFMDRMKSAETSQQPACKSEASPPRPATSKCLLSPYVTVPKPVDVGDAYCCEATSTPEELLIGKSRTRAQLMSQVRLHQPLQPVRFRHDRTAQELAQEGYLPSRSLCEAFPWQSGYKYTPYPEPKLLVWTKDEAERRLERQRLAKEFDRVETPPPAAGTPPTLPTSPPILPMPPPPPAPVAEPLSSSLLVPPPQAEDHQQQQRPRSGRAKPARRAHQKHHHKEQQQLTPEQQLAEKSAARRRNFSVSTIGEEELEPARLEQQRLTEVCQRLRDRQLAREVAAAAAAAEAAAAEAAAAEAALKAAAEAASAPAEPPAPPTPLQSDEKSSRKKRGGSAGSGKKKRPAAQEKQKKKTQPKSPRSASSGSEKGAGAAKKQKSSAAQSRSSSASSDSGKPTDERKKNLSSQQQSKQKKAGSLRAKSPKGGKKAPASKKGKAPIQKQLQKVPPPPPQPTLETEIIEPAGPDPIDLLADEIEAAQVFHRTKAPGELPDFPCPSSEDKSRKQLTKVWWQRRAISTSAGVSVIT